MVFDEQFSFSISRSSSLGSSHDSITSTSRDRSVSPCSAVRAFPAPSFTVTDLAASFGRSRLRQEAQICYDPCEAYANLDDDAEWQLDPVPTIEAAVSPPRPGARVMPPRPHSLSQRQQRQSNCRSLCSSSHQQEISALIARMVNQEEQCIVNPAESLEHPSTLVDEGYDSSDGSEQAGSRRSSFAIQKVRLEYRRSLDPKKAGACVNKSIRLRKDKTQRRKLGA